MTTDPKSIARRGFLARGGALIVSFSLLPRSLAATVRGADAQLPGDLGRAPMLDAWIRIDPDDSITVFTGKAELGQGIQTAILQVAAEELMVPPRHIRLVTADTARTPDESYTAGSQSMSHSATAVQSAAAQVRALLVDRAARRFGVPAEHLVAENGAVRAVDGRHISYGALVAGEKLHVHARADAPLRDVNSRSVIGRSLPRVDIPRKLTGQVIYVQDLRLPGMVHARVVRPPGYGARLRQVDVRKVESMPGVLKVVRNGSFLAVIAAHQYEALQAMRALANAAVWDEPNRFPPQPQLYSHFQRLPQHERVIAAGAPLTGRASAAATYRRPYQMHGAIGPSCAVALFKDKELIVWTHSQGVYPLRRALAEMLDMPQAAIRCIHREGSGCYGHNGADDAAADAALLAAAFPARPVRVQWRREDEHAWEPYGSAMIVEAKARLDESGKVARWQHDVWSCTHSTRPPPAGNLLAARYLEKPFQETAPHPIPQPAGGGDRNAIPLYQFGAVRVVEHFITAMPLRVSALRSLGAYMNVFAIESFMDELARAAKADPVEFRLRHLEDPRARDVVQMAARKFGWSSYPARRGRGRGFGFARYKNYAAYAAVACEAEVEHETGRVRMLRAVAAVDSGEAVNPDGIRNQIEGGILQSLSWTLFESVRFSTQRITSVDWGGYPILRFPNLPDSIDVHLISRPGEPFLGTGEAAQGPAAAAIANAVADAAGVRIREVPLSPERLKAAIGP